MAGAGLLLFNFNLFAAYEPLFQYVAAGILGAGALGFGGAYLSTPTHWWRLIPAWTLLSLASMVLLTASPGVNQRLVGGVLFLGLALAFAHIYLLDRQERWWAIIPGGFMLVLGGVIALSSRTERAETLGALLFGGMGLVFFLLYLLDGRRRQWWALIPGTVLILFGFFIFVLDRTGEAGGNSQLLSWWPLFLMALGIFLGWRAYRKQPGQKLPLNSAPGLGRTPRPVSGSVNRSARTPGALGEYNGPAPGASVELLPDGEESSRE